MTGMLTTFRSLRWSCLPGVALLLAASVLVGNTARPLRTHAVENPASTISTLSVSASPVALPAAPALARGLLPHRASGPAFGAVLAVACCLWVQTLLRGWTSEPPRAASGRRGRALLHAYLN
jgi:hypothetical protein